ncbi:MAG: hypothetical protein E7406_02520 [Ruminococcaceae bacterium]|nr:hypothetical protein [Oscillospiraceae bacterium]
MSIVNFSEEYYEAERTFNECVDKLNAILDEDGKEILSSLLKAEHIILTEQMGERFKEGWYHGVNFTR